MGNTASLAGRLIGESGVVVGVFSDSLQQKEKSCLFCSLDLLFPPLPLLLFLLSFFPSHSPLLFRLFKKKKKKNSPLPKTHRFSPRHNSLTPAEEAEMVAALGFGSLDELIDATVPASIRADKPLDLGEYSEGYTESEFLEKFK